MKKTTIICVMALSCLNFFAEAQEMKPLNLGQKIPATTLNQNYPVLGTATKQHDSLNLSQFKGKLILLDFWATWCTNCIYKFDLLGQLQEKYKTQFQVVLVNAKYTKDTPERMRGILSGEKAPFIKANLTTIYNDTVLYKLFPHSYLPHYVWLGAKGEVLAITGAEMINEQTIEHYLADIKDENNKAQAELTNKP
ncbi:TlpA family protein disulfide reductase [Pedobacter frigiditerrae]|uniref:TlpA family protein disulfide reductase n=1 Tax=Pedobacter frigiditerrae TaxID=2530452 RepID=A0A4R0N4A2_9SPHI|nr:TlpA disulfide reductase family protein [Pedobacter frigiditerrae]TCC94187.1 TlpA family protein disulfide reductase [Pedobacter frigiditerrae]